MRRLLLCLLLAACGDGSTPGPALPGEPDASPPPVDASAEPTPVQSGLYSLEGERWLDLGLAPLDAPVRLVIALSLRERAELEQRVQGIYDPLSPSYRSYVGSSELVERHAPSSGDVDAVVEWLLAQGFTVPYRAGNRLLVAAHGTAASFQTAFGAGLHALKEVDSEMRAYGTPDPLRVPAWVAVTLEAVLTADLPADASPLPAELGEVTTSPPEEAWRGFTPAQIAHAYGVDVLHAAGHRGEGVRLGIVAGATFKQRDVQSFWRSFGIDRADPRVVVTMEPIATRYLETTLDIQWAGALAPGAELVVYQGPDARDSSLVFTFNEAVALGEVSVITDSFAHHEASVTRAVREQYDRSALWAAALGVTVVSSTGNAGKPDAPATSPFVTGVGGTELQLDAGGEVLTETAWSESGSGESLTFAAPPWQIGLSPGKRCLADVALNAGRPYWVYRFGLWERWRGTSFASPVLAGLVATAASRRLVEGQAALGWLNPMIYGDPILRASFRDVTVGATVTHAAGIGWDFPTGWGAPDAAALATAP